MTKTFLIVSFSLNGKAEASETEENNDVISIEKFDSLQEEGVIDPNLSYEEFVGSIDSNLGTLEEVEEVDVNDDEELSEYGLTTTEEGEVISVPAQSPGSFSTMAAATHTYPGTKIIAKAGDILVTNSTSSSGFSGHAGIVTSNGIMFSSIANTKANPRNLSLKDWFSKYKNTKVVRINSSTKAKTAANWATSYVRNHANASYSITTNLKGLDPTYCSKIVWQAYVLGGTGVFDNRSVGIKVPYNLLYKGYYKGVTPKRVALIGSNFGANTSSNL